MIIDGHELRVIDRGRGPAILLVHGFAGSANDFRHNIEPLARAGLRVVAVDLVGMGYSSKPSAWDYTIPAQAKVLARLLRELGIERAHVAGNSYGGGVALAMALLEPGSVDRLVFIGTACYPQPIPPAMKALAYSWVARLFDLMPRPAVKVVVRGFFQECFHDQSLLPEDAIEESTRQLHGFGSARALGKIVRALGDPGVLALAGRIPEIRRPTLIIWGRHDRVVPLRLGERLTREIAGSRLAVLDHCGHVPQMEDPAEVNRLMLEFLLG